MNNDKPDSQLSINKNLFLSCRSESPPKAPRTIQDLAILLGIPLELDEEDPIAVQSAYKYLASLQENYSQLTQALVDTDTLGTQTVQVLKQIGSEMGKKTLSNLEMCENYLPKPSPRECWPLGSDQEA